MMISPEKRDLLIRLNRIEGQIRGLQQLVSNDLCCDDVLTQVNAAQMALVALGVKLLEQQLDRNPTGNKPDVTTMMVDWVASMRTSPNEEATEGQAG